MRYSPAPLLVAILAAGAALTPAAAQTASTFTYQGSLQSAGSPYTGTADYRFSLWDAPTGGSQIGPTAQADKVAVNAGLFTAGIDFGGAAHGPGRFLQIEVRTPAWDGGGIEPPFFTFPDRTPMTAAPYSLSTRGIFVNEAADMVGIGTEEPTHTLHVAGKSDATALIESDSAQGTWLNLLNTSSEGRFWRLISTGSENSPGPGNLLIGHGTDPEVNTPVMTMLAEGQVGIGTVTPKAMLHNAGDYYGKGLLALHADAGDGVSGNAFVQARDDSGSSSIGMHLRTQEAGAPRDAVVISPSGDVGIGTASPQRRLDVEGDVRFGGDHIVVELGDDLGDTVLVPGTLYFGDGSYQAWGCPAASATTVRTIAPILPGERAVVNGLFPNAKLGDVLIVGVRGDTPPSCVVHGAYVPSDGQYRFFITNVGDSIVNQQQLGFDILAIRSL